MYIDSVLSGPRFAIVYIYFLTVVTVLGSKVLELGPFRTTYC